MVTKKFSASDLKNQRESADPNLRALYFANKRIDFYRQGTIVALSLFLTYNLGTSKNGHIDWYETGAIAFVLLSCFFEPYIFELFDLEYKKSKKSERAF